MILRVVLGSAVGLASQAAEPSSTESGDPGREWHVAVSGDDVNAGLADDPFRTINRAADRALPGDTVIVHEGVYREQIRLPRGGAGEDSRIVYRAAEGETVVVTGSERIQGWVKRKDGVWQVSIDNAFFGDFNPYELQIEGGWLEAGEWHHRGEVYLNGTSLFERRTRAEVFAEDLTWHPRVDDSRTLLTANFGEANPNTEFVEINVRAAFVLPERVGLSYITIDGFHFRHSATNWAAPVLVDGTPEEKAAYRQEGGIATRMGRRWVIQNNRITDVKGVGIVSGKDSHQPGDTDPYRDLDNFGDHEILNNRIARCGQSGIAGFYGLSRSVIRGNLIEDINHKQQYGGWETAAIKFHLAVDVRIEDNLIRRVYKAEEGGAYGIWIDVGNQSIRLSRNIIYDTEEYPVYLEMNPGPILMENNVIFGTVRLRGSRGLVSAHNLFFEGGFTFREEPEREGPFFLPHSRTKAGTITGLVRENRFLNDLYIDCPLSEDPSDQPGTRADSNVYLGTSVQSREIGPRSREDAAFRARMEHIETPDGVSIRFLLPTWVSETDCDWIDAESVGDFALFGDSIEDRFGNAVRVNRDLFSRKRSRPLPGPLARPDRENEIRWKFREVE